MEHSDTTGSLKSNKKHLQLIIVAISSSSRLWKKKLELVYQRQKLVWRLERTVFVAK